MKKIVPLYFIIILVFLLLGVGIGVVMAYPMRVRDVLSSFSQSKSKKNTNNAVATSKKKKEMVRKQTIFVPYWQLGAGLNPVFPDKNANKQYVYFSLPATQYGIDTESDAVKGISTFDAQVPKGASKQVVVSMTNPDENYAIFASKEARDTIIEQSVAMAKEHGYSGVILDLEMPPLLSDKVPESILSFTQAFSKGAHEGGLLFGVTFFGDTFYRARPFKVREIAQVADEVYIMAYDFHKPTGSPGPNFPFEAGKEDSYDFLHMVTDFTAVIPKNKINVIYGMYGYDWIVTIEKKPIKAATVLTDREIQDMYENRCRVMNCVITRDPRTKEELVEFIDEHAAYHVIWHEDLVSAERKTNYLLSQGVDSVAYWAYGYY